MHGEKKKIRIYVVLEYKEEALSRVDVATKSLPSLCWWIFVACRFIKPSALDSDVSKIIISHQFFLKKSHCLDLIFLTTSFIQVLIFVLLFCH